MGALTGLRILRQKDLPKGPLSIEFFEQLPAGTVLRLYYYNAGRLFDYYWKHSHVADDRVFGAFYYDDGSDLGWSGTSDYMYEFMGDVCRGSGADPVYARRPAKRDRYS